MRSGSSVSIGVIGIYFCVAPTEPADILRGRPSAPISRRAAGIPPSPWFRAGAILRAGSAPREFRESSLPGAGARSHPSPGRRASDNYRRDQPAQFSAWGSFRRRGAGRPAGARRRAGVELRDHFVARLTVPRIQMTRAGKRRSAGQAHAKSQRRDRHHLPHSVFSIVSIWKPRSARFRSQNAKRIERFNRCYRNIFLIDCGGSAPFRTCVAGTAGQAASLRASQRSRSASARRA